MGTSFPLSFIYSISYPGQFVKRFSKKILEKENITKESTQRCPLPSPDQCAINDAADKVFGDAPYDGVCRQSRGLIFPDCNGLSYEFHIF